MGQTVAEATIRAYCRSRGYPEPVAEWEFNSEAGRRWRFDLAWPEPSIRVAIEIHGAIHTQGRHTRGNGFEEDRSKINTAQTMGWIVLECTYRHIAKGLVFVWLDEALQLRRNAEHAPSLQQPMGGGLGPPG